MTQVAVQTQVEAIKMATQKALQSKEAALKFLTDAGILKEDNKHKVIKEKGKK
jgi:ribosomal protein S9